MTTIQLYGEQEVSVDVLLSHCLLKLQSSEYLFCTKLEKTIFVVSVIRFVSLTNLNRLRTSTASRILV